MRKQLRNCAKTTCIRKSCTLPARLIFAQFLALAALLLCLGMPCLAVEEDSARTEWMGGFVKMEEADKNLSTNAVVALDLYKGALSVFESVRRKHPNWNPALLNYRINYCQQKINELQRRLESLNNKLTPEELLEINHSQAKKLQELEEQNKELDARISFMSEALLRAREEAAKSASLESNANALAAARTELEKKNADLALRLKEAEGRLAALSKENSSMDKARKDMEKLKTRAERAEQDLEKSDQELRQAKAELSKLQKEHRSLARQHESSASSLKRSTEQNEKLSDNVSELEKKLKIAEARVAAKDKTVSELNREFFKNAPEDLALLKKELDRERAVGLDKEERNIDLMAQLSRLKAKSALVESQNIRLTTQIEEYRIINEKLSGEGGGAAVKADASNDELEKKLELRTELGRKLEQELEKANTEMDELRQKLVTAEKEGKAARERESGLEAKLELCKDEIKVLNAKMASYSGVTGNLVDAENRNKEFEARLNQTTKELSQKDRAMDNAARLSQEKEEFFRKQLAEKDELIATLNEKNPTAKEWLDKIKRINQNLDGEVRKRMALEAALLELESRVEGGKTEATGKEAGTQRPTPARDANLRIAQEQERKAMINGLLRQATDSEKQGRIEAARFYYNKTLDMDADNLVALQRMGVLAAKEGNDRDAVKYLRQAFRFDTDNMDTLLALGYAQARLGEANWAVSYLGRAVALDPDNAYAARTYGSALFNMGWTQAAETQLLHASKLKPDDPEAAFNLAVLYATAKEPDYKEAAKWYKTALKNGAQADPGLDAVLKDK